MASIPLPALGVKVPQQESPLDTYAKFAQLKSLQNQQQIQQQQITAGGQENQMRASQLRDQQIVRQSYMDAGGDLDKTAMLAAQRGAMPKTVFDLRNAGLDWKQKIATVTKDQAANQLTKVSLGEESAGRVLAAAPEDRPAAYAAERQGLLNSGLYDPKEVPEQYPGDDFIKLHQVAANHLKQTLAQVAEAGSKASTAASEAILKGKEAETAQNGVPVNEQFAKAKYREILQSLQAGKNVTPQQLDYAKSYEASERKTTTTSDSLGVTSSNTSGPAGLASVRRGGAVGAGAGGSANPQSTANSIVDMVGQYKLNPTMLSRMLVKHPDVIAQVQQKYPDWDQADYNSKNTLLTKYTSGEPSRQINAVNTALGHLGVLKQASDALSGGNIQVLNRLANFVGVQVGQDPVTTYNTIVHRVGPELTAAYVAGGGGEGERGANAKDFDPSLSPDQRNSNIGISAQLLRSKISSLAQQYQNTVKRNDFEQRFLTPDAQKTLQSLNPRSGGATQHAPGKPAGLAEGQTGTGSDGKKYIVKGGVWIPQQ